MNGTICPGNEMFINPELDPLWSAACSRPLITKMEPTDRISSVWA